MDNNTSLKLLKNWKTADRKKKRTYRRLRQEGRFLKMQQYHRFHSWYRSFSNYHQQKICDS